MSSQTVAKMSESNEKAIQPEMWTSMVSVTHQLREALFLQSCSHLQPGFQQTLQAIQNAMLAVLITADGKGLVHYTHDSLPHDACAVTYEQCSKSLQVTFKTVDLLLKFGLPGPSQEGLLGWFGGLRACSG